MTTVTPLSKTIALITFIVSPLIAFYLGSFYSINPLAEVDEVIVSQDTPDEINIPTEENEDEPEEEGIETVIIEKLAMDDWTLVTNDYGYSFSYPEQITDATYSQELISTETKLKEFEEIQLTDKGTSYWIEDQLYKLSTFLHIESLVKEDLDIEAIATALLEIEQDNENIYVETVQEPIETTFKGKDAYTFSAITSGITYINADGTSSGGILGSDGVIKSYVVDNGNRYLVISYYDTAIYQMILETFQFTD